MSHLSRGIGKKADRGKVDLFPLGDEETFPVWDPLHVIEESVQRGGGSYGPRRSRAELEALDIAGRIFQNSEFSTRRASSKEWKWLFAVRQNLLIAAVRVGAEELVRPRGEVLSIETHSLAPIDEGEREIYPGNHSGELTAENRDPVLVPPIGPGLSRGIDPEIDVAAIRRKRDAIIFVGRILDNGSLAVGWNVVKHEGLRTVRIIQHGRQIDTVYSLRVCLPRRSWESIITWRVFLRLPGPIP